MIIAAAAWDMAGRKTRRGTCEFARVRSCRSGEKRWVQCGLSCPVRAPCGQGLRVSVLRLQMLLWLGRNIQKHTSTEELEELQ